MSNNSIEDSVWSKALGLGLALLLGLLGCRSGPAATGPSSTRQGALAAVVPAAYRDAAWDATQTRPLPSLRLVPAADDADPTWFAADLREGFQGDIAALPALTVYRIEADLDEAARRLNVRQEVRYVNRARQPLPELYLRLTPNQLGHRGSLVVDAVHVPGRRAGWALAVEDTALRIELEPPLLPGEALRILTAHRVVVPEDNPIGYGIFTYRDGLFALGHFYAWIPVYSEHGWHLDLLAEFGDATFTDVALYDVTVTAPADMRVVGTGRVVDERLRQDGTMSTRLVAGPVRDFGLTIGRGLQTVGRDVEGIWVSSYYQPGYEREGAAVLRYAADALSVFQRRFGAYPYRELQVVKAPIRVVGMEYPGLILIAERIYRPVAPSSALPLEFTVVHEVAHQWWYGLVGSDQQGEPWLDEALATYAVILYYEDVYGPERARQEMEALISAPYRRAVSQGRDMAMRQPVAAFTRPDYYPIVYCKGALYLHALRQQAGDARFDSMLQAFLAEFRYRNARSDDFYRVVEREMGPYLGDLRLWWLANAPPDPFVAQQAAGHNWTLPQRP